MLAKTAFLLVLISSLALGQTFQQEIGSIPVSQNGRQLQIPWNGGFNTMSIALPDIDGDSDPDLLLVGRDDGRLHFYRNDGGGSNGNFIFVNAAVSDLEFGPNDNRIAFDDIDFDGDLDLFVGENDGRIKYFRNDGGSSSPAFTLVTNFLDSLNVGFVSAPAFGDLNDDGLNDLVVGSFREGFFFYTRDDSNSTDFTFVDTLRNQAGEILKPGFQFYVPALVDIDGDGDLDLFGSSNENHLAFFRNVGSVSSPQFTLEDANFLVPPRFMDFLTPAFVDIDSDLDFDLFFGNNHGFVAFYRNQGDSFSPSFVLESEQLQLDFLDFGFLSFPTFIDIDADTDPDCFVGTEDGRLHFLRNAGSPAAPDFEWVSDRFIMNLDLVVYPAWGDLDADGDFDLLVGQASPPILYYRNNGTPQVAQLDSMGALLDTLGAQVQHRRPVLGDIDGDSDLDLFVNVFRQSEPNAILIYENVGRPDSAAFILKPDTLRDESGEVIARFDMFFRLADFNFDGDLDLFIGRASGTTAYYENVGSASAASFRQVTDFFAGISTGNNARNSPFLVDIDNDEDLDIFTGRFMGGLLFHRNTTDPTSVSEAENGVPRWFSLEQNFPNPFNPETSIRYQLPVETRVQLRIFDVLGRTVRTIVQEEQPAGTYTVIWDGRTDHGTSAASGLYFYRLQTGEFEHVAKMLLIK